MKTQSRKKKESGTGVRERILDTATSLFYKQGFSNTGMRQIIQESNSVAASLYDHYPSKKELGLAYLSRQEEKTLSDLQDLMDRYPDLGEFLRAWVILKENKSAMVNSWDVLLRDLRAKLWIPIRNIPNFLGIS